MTLWIKICGLTTPAAVAAAIDAGVDAIGFVFAPSSRQVTAARAAELSRAVPDTIVRVAVMRHPTQALLDAVWSSCRPQLLQTDVEDLEHLDVPRELGVLPVLRGAAVPSERFAKISALYAESSKILFEGPQSGTGTVADWQTAASLARTRSLVLAGGLNGANVAAAIAAVRPDGVDVSSGVESQPGVKDPLKMVAFVRAARAAAAAVGL